MKKYLLTCAAFLLLFSSVRAQVVDKIGVRGPLCFNHTEFELGGASHPISNYFIQEYLPKGETPEQFNQMLTIFLVVGDIKLELAIQEKLEELEARKKKDQTSNYTVTENSDHSEYMIDFLVGESKNDKMMVQEFNVRRYKQVDLGKNQKAILVYAYSKRAYGDDIASFLKNFEGYRMEMLNEMGGCGMPAIRIVE